MRYFLIAVALILLGILIGVLAARFLPLNTNSTFVPTPTETITPTITVTPEVTPDLTNTLTPLVDASETAKWKTIANPVYSFKYPSSWKVSGTQIISTIPQITIFTYLPKEPMMNECMQLVETNTSGDLMIKKYSQITTGEACSNPDTGKREIWVTQAGGDGFAPGIQYLYQEADSEVAEKTLRLLLSTFKFTVTAKTSYSCPTTSYVDCMPGPDTGTKTECTAEFLTWSKANCPGFQGAAY